MKDHTQDEANKLVGAVAKGRPFVTTLVIALVLHVAVLGVTSIPYFMKVTSYGTWDVRGAMDAERQAAEEDARALQLAERRAEAEKNRTAREEKKKAEAEEQAEQKKNKKTDARAREIDTTRPEDSSLSLDEEFGL
ncbi:MAG TPA: hypothetical protein DCR55_03755 [Lentisphaeria bacterium]|nr:hypothetical protein [Lentisphaeria bacterium]